MSSNPERLRYLFQQYLHDTGTPAEIREFWVLFSELGNDNPIKEDLWRFWDKTDAKATRQHKDWEQLLQRIRQQAKTWENSQTRRRTQRALWGKMAVASVLLMLLLTGGYWVLTNQTNTKTQSADQEAHLQNDRPPGGNRAVLTLGNGTQIILDSVHSGQLAQQGNSNVVKVDNGQIVYTVQNTSPLPLPSKGTNRAVGPETERETPLNTLSTPRGGQYRITLADGTKVWLDAASSIRYPVAFNGHQRKVKVSGQVYFEVAENAALPFIVNVNDRAEILVLGTHFNIKAYPDERKLRTTVLEGKISLRSMTKDTPEVILLPGNQAEIDRNGKLTKRTRVDLESVIAWKNNYFVFNNSSLKEVMRQLSRWYDIEVEYSDTKDVLLNGRFKRSTHLSVALKILQTAANVKFTITGKKIIVDYKETH